MTKEAWAIPIRKRGSDGKPRGLEPKLSPGSWQRLTACFLLSLKSGLETGKASRSEADFFAGLKVICSHSDLQIFPEGSDSYG